MMTLRDLINKLLGREQASANTARERLQLVLAHDRVDMSSLTTNLLEIRFLPIFLLFIFSCLFSTKKKI